MNSNAPVPAAQPTWRGSLLSGRSLRYAAGVLLVAGGYWAAAKGAEAVMLALAAAFYAATGVGIAVLYLGGLRWWPGVLLGDLLGDLLGRPIELPLWVALVRTAVHVVVVLAAAIILRRLVGRRAAMDRLEQVGAVVVAIVVGEAVSATVMTLVAQAGDIIETSAMGVFWRSWWLGGLAGGLVVVPLALAWAHTSASAWRGRRVVEAALMLAAVVGLSLLAFSADQPFTYIVFPAFIWAALRLGPPGATLAVAVAAVIAVAASSRQLGPFVVPSAIDTALNLQLYIVLAALTTLCLAAIVSERRRAALELAESQRREGERAALERQRMARDLHDSVSQSLFSATLHVRSAQLELELEEFDTDGPVGEELREIGQLTRGALAEMRALILELQPGALAEEGLVAALAKQAAALSAREGLVIEVDGPDGRLPLDAEVEEQLYRLGQEALANVVKHARASTATVHIAVADGTVTVEVADDGRGFDPATVGPEHFGLRSMRGRVADLGGRLELTSAPGAGTVLRVQVSAQR